jgi:hypothetical protein
VSEQIEAIARQAFADISARFPHLEITENLDHPVEISLTLPQQPGMKHQVWLALQNEDELHFSVGHFWLEWFPCTRPERVEQFVESVCGFLSGQYRVIEHNRGQSCFKAELQKPSSQGWETIGTWSRLRWPSFRRSAVTELVNA